MTHHKQPNDIDRLTYNFVKISIDKSNGDLTIPLNFISIYQEACQGTIGIHDKFDQSNLELRQHVRDNLLSNGYIFVDPKDAEYFSLTQKSIDEYDKLPEEKW